MADKNDAHTPPPPLGEKELRAQLQDTESALETIKRAWLEHYYYEEASPPDLGQARRDAERVLDVSNPEWITTSEKTRVLAYAFVLAADRCVEALERLKAQIAYSHPEETEELYRRIRELRGGEGYTTNP